jgi:hypothetical protein
VSSVSEDFPFLFQISVRFRSLIGKLLVNGPKVAGHAADDKTKTKYSENEADISVIVDR